MSSDLGPLPFEQEDHTDSDEESAPNLDAVIRQIETDLVVVHRVVRRANGSSQTPLNGVRFREVRAIFQRMAECPLLTESGEDIEEFDAPCKEGAESPSNGSEP